MRRLNLTLSAALISASAVATLAPAAPANAFLDAASFADNLVEYERGEWEGWNPDHDHQYNGDATLGENDWDYTMVNDVATGTTGWEQGVIGSSLGPNGWVTVEFVDNALVGDGDVTTNDLWIFEIGKAVESIMVEISVDNETWYDVGLAVRENNLQDYGIGMDIDWLIQETEELTLDTLFSFVRVTDTGDNVYSNGKAGADIDAIAAISSRDIPEPTSILGLFAVGAAFTTLKRKSAK